MRTTLICILMAAVFTSGAFAETVIDFQPLEHVDADLDFFGSEYSEDGFTLSEGNSGSLGTVGTLDERFSGSTAIVGEQNSLFILTRSGGGLFEVNSIDLTEFSTTASGVPTVNFTGIRSDGGIASQSFTLDGAAFVAESFAFDSSFDSVVALVWLQTSPNHQFDNIDVTTIPEPTSAAFGFLVVSGLIFRRRR